MKRRPRLHPCLGIPTSERRRIALICRLALAELAGADPSQALSDLHAAARVLRELVAGERFTCAARQAAQEAAQAVESVWAGTTLPAAALAPATAAVELLELVLPLVTLRRLEAAKAAALQRLAQSRPTAPGARRFRTSSRTGCDFRTWFRT